MSYGRRLVTRLATIALLGILAAGVAGGCGSTGDKVGAPPGPVELRLADPYDSSLSDVQALHYITDQVDRISHGSLRVKIVYDAAGRTEPDVEARVARLVQDGKFDLGWIGARAWDELGIRSFQALQAPFLITDYPLLDRVLTGPLADRMLSGLQSRDLVGLALVPDLLRHPMGLTHPLVSLTDYRGARIRDIPSRATDSLLRALGATPVHVAKAEFGAAIAAKRIDGQELAVINGLGSTITGNVSFFPRVMTLFAGRRAFDRLSAKQKAVLAEAEAQLRRHIFAPSENALIAEACSAPGTRVVLASAREIAQLERAAQPATAALERDPQTKATISAIRKLKASLPPPPAIVVPTGCSAKTSSPPPPARSTSELDGTYRYVLTASAARRFGEPGDSPEKRYPLVVTVVLRDGTLAATLDQPPDRGTYSVAGKRLIIRVEGNTGLPDVFTFARGGDTLRLTPVLPMDRGDQWVWSGAVWHRVGPPDDRALR